jgi:hypothetical protein|nr:MAG TPA_asm: protein of unknown function DUF2466 [Caudoviricetes sp.]
MGGRGGSGSFGFASINAARAKIANLKKEQLFVFAPSGDLLYKEQGTAQHAGYGDTDYKGNIVLHNHPEGVLPVPSLKDIETWQKSGAKAIIIESRDATFTLSGPHNKGFYETLAYNHNYVRRAVREAANKVSADYKAGKYKSPQEAKAASRKAQTEATNNVYAKFAKAAGVKYAFKWKKKKS